MLAAIDLSRSVGVLLLCCLAVSSCATTSVGSGELAGSSAVGPSAISYESYRDLDLTTPVAGAQALIEAWSQRDFVLVQQLLDRTVQRAMLNAEQSNATSPFVVEFANPQPAISREGQFPGWRSAERLLVAARTGGMQADLAGARVDGPARAATVGDRTVRDVDVVLADGRSAVLRMAPSVSGRWRLLQVGVPTLEGASEESIVVVDACSVDPRVMLHDDVSCDLLDVEIGVVGLSEAELEAEIERINLAAGDNPTKLVEAEQHIRNLVASQRFVSARDLCGRMQGFHVFAGRPLDLSGFAADAARLAETTCPGDPALVLHGLLDEPASGDVSPDEIVSYASLDLADPTAAVQTFVSLVEEQEHFRLATAVAAQAQTYVSRELFWGDLDSFSGESWQSWSAAAQEHAVLVPGIFDDLLRRAAEADDYLVDVRGVVEVAEPVALEAFGERQAAVLIEATSDRHPGGLGFVVVQAPSGRWRVRQVASPPEAIDPDHGLFVLGG